MEKLFLQLLSGCLVIGFGMFILLPLYVLGEWVFGDGLKQGVFRMGFITIGLFILWSIGALVSGV